MVDKELSFQEVEELLDCIVHNRKLCQVEKQGSPEWLFFRFPSAKEVQVSRFIRDRALAEAEKAGLPSIHEVEDMIKNRKLITEGDIAKVEELEKKLEAQNKLLSMTRIPGRRAPIEEAIANFTAQIQEIKSKGDSYLYLSRERKADEESVLYLVWA